ncbi:MAG: hypothetical protein V9E94_20920 [Microthrixaceae bacterium]
MDPSSTPLAVGELTGTLAHLPVELAPEPVEARQFDLLMFEPAARPAARRAAVHRGCGTRSARSPALLRGALRHPRRRRRARPDPGHPDRRVVDRRHRHDDRPGAAVGFGCSPRSSRRPSKKVVYTNFVDELGDDVDRRHPRHHRRGRASRSSARKAQAFLDAAPRQPRGA